MVAGMSLNRSWHLLHSIDPAGRADPQKQGQARPHPGFHRVVKLSGVLIIFAAITYFLGIYIGLLLMVPTVMYLLGERKKLILAVFSVSTCLFVFMIFKLLLMVPLPTGLLFD